MKRTLVFAVGILLLIMIFPAFRPTVQSKALVLADNISELSGLTISAPVVVVKECNCVYYYDGSSWVQMTAVPIARTQSAVTRSFNTSFQLSTTHDGTVEYSVDVSCSLSLTTGATGTVFLEIADDSAFTTNVQELSRFVNGNTGTLTIGLGLTQNVTGVLSGFVPRGKYVRIRTNNTSGSPTFTYRSGQETLI